MQLKYIPDSFSNLTPVKYLHLFFQSPRHGPVYLNQGVSEEGRGVGDQTVRGRSPLPVWIVGDFVGS